MRGFYVLHDLTEALWAKPLFALEEALALRNKDAALSAYQGLYRALLEGGSASLVDAILEALLTLETAASRRMMRGEPLPDGLKAGLHFDLRHLSLLLLRDWQAETVRLVSAELPPLSALAPAPETTGPNDRFLELLKSEAWDEAVAQLERHYQKHGAGTLARFLAFRWERGKLVGIAHPDEADMARLVGVERQLKLLKQNTEAFLAGLPAHHTLLYGPRGSGKSTAVRALLPRYRGEGLRLVGLSPTDLTDLPAIMESLRGRPHRYVIFVDDLSFEEGGGHGPLKTLLEGSLTARPDNLIVYATSNRRHLVKEHFSDRPDPLNDDVHGWDTVNEHLALADRFGLTLTFPSATQARYLEIVQGLAQREGLEDEALEEHALKFASWGNGFSGRTAKQFIDSLKQGRPSP